MTLWFLLALMTAAAVFAVLWPLGRNVQTRHENHELAIYKDQLVEIKCDRTSGLIAAPEAEAARIEIGRRLLATANTKPTVQLPSSTALRRGVAVVALIGLPLMTVTLYLIFGSPQLPGFPLAMHPPQTVASASLPQLVAQVEAHLGENPSDGRGWQVLAPALMQLGQFDKAVQAFRNSITANGENATRRADLGEAIVAAANGIVTTDARTEFERAIALNSREDKARYFLGMAAEQDGRAQDAAAIWRAMLNGAPHDAPWRPIVQAALARVDGALAPALPDEEIARAKGMVENDRSAMIHGMVDRLATRLKQNGDDVEGWLRLVRAYMVLGETSKARAARTDAREAVGRDADRLKQLNEGLKELGLEG